MNHREKHARDQAVISISIGLSLSGAFVRESYARIGRHRRNDNRDRFEQLALDELAKIAASRLAPFAAIDGDQVYHWQITEPIVRQSLCDVPMEIRTGFASRSQKEASQDIARRVIIAVDQRFRLVPLPGYPGPGGCATWQEIFAAEHATLL